MCKCNPNVRTPFCGKLGCEWPKKEGVKEMGECEHEKVYSQTVLLSYPFQYHWICRLCKEEGIDIGKEYGEYYYLKEEKRKMIEGWVQAANEEINKKSKRLLTENEYAKHGIFVKF